MKNDSLVLVSFALVVVKIEAFTSPRIFLWHLSANVTAVSKQAGWGGYLHIPGFIELHLVVPSGSVEVLYKL